MFLVCGDVHGQLMDLISIFKACGNPADTQYLFLGNYVNGGLNSIEVSSFASYSSVFSSSGP
jgi:hypothetical protein